MSSTDRPQAPQPPDRGASWPDSPPSRRRDLARSATDAWPSVAEWREQRDRLRAAEAAASPPEKPEAAAPAPEESGSGGANSGPPEGRSGRDTSSGTNGWGDAEASSDADASDDDAAVPSDAPPYYASGGRDGEAKSGHSSAPGGWGNDILHGRSQERENAQEWQGTQEGQGGQDDSVADRTTATAAGTSSSRRPGDEWHSEVLAGSSWFAAGESDSERRRSGEGRRSGGSKKRSGRRRSTEEFEWPGDEPAGRRDIGAEWFGDGVGQRGHGAGRAGDEAGQRGSGAGWFGDEPTAQGGHGVGSVGDEPGRHGEAAGGVGGGVGQPDGTVRGFGGGVRGFGGGAGRHDEAPDWFGRGVGQAEERVGRAKENAGRAEERAGQAEGSAGQREERAGRAEEGAGRFESKERGRSRRGGRKSARQRGWLPDGPDAESSAATSPQADPESVARAICLRLLTMAPKTRAQLAEALRKRDVPEEAAEAVLSRFSELGLINDEAFAAAWVDSRHHGRGLAKRALAAELRRRGVDGDTVNEAVERLDPDQEEETARRLVERKLASTRSLDPQTRTRRLAGMLARKGYPSGLAFRVIREALEQEGIEVEEDFS
ncbi:recombination regulator RecX [Nonomuraea sp. FMUSA5-5]|uniref:Regulatory protein RecX n=1 Tax=Nonomuraea composti TaxID=2720023 RepID=A0ABX1BLB3_9ACTN|nr:recombination regulator RecX [Nonomuraea sp. FMUSA5-5]NJP97190.1 recombination regulator RecX [Nonomuraea sp. FMUSA5-5]